MKATDYIIIFVIITIPFMLIKDLKAKNTDLLAYKKISFDKILDVAVDGAASQMIEESSNETVNINKQKAVDFFFYTFFVNMKILDNKLQQDQIIGCVPVIVITDYTGYYLLSSEKYKNASGDNEVKLVWHPKKFYSTTRDKYVFNFSLDLNYVSVFNIENNTYITGAYEDIKAKFSESYMVDKNEFDQMRRTSIIDALRSDVNEYINRHNEIAKSFNIFYNFKLPSIDQNDWERTISDYGMLAFFQGMPIGAGEYYNNYALGGSRIIKSKKLFIQVDLATGLKYYHRESCSLVTDKDKIVDDRKNAALEGALPCKVCSP